jgi:hypothetical protein
MDNNGAVIFSINFTVSENSTGAPSLYMTTLYASAINDACVATLSVDTCKIDAAVVEYPVVIQNTTVTLNRNELQDLAVVSTYISTGDLPTAAVGADAGPLAGLRSLFGIYLSTRATMDVNPSQGSYIYRNDGGNIIIAHLFYDSEPSSYNAYAFKNCALQWSSPTKYILDSIKDFMFRAALHEGNDTEVQTFPARRTSPALLFHSDHHYLGAALAIMLLALLAVLFLFWGWWELGRPVSLSPLETAKAFGAPMMQRTGRNSAVQGILGEIGEVRVRYDGRLVDDGSGVPLLEM